MRKTFNIVDFKPDAMLLNTHHEKEVAVHLNGVIIHQESGRLDHNSETYPNDGFRAALKPEGNRP